MSEIAYVAYKQNHFCIVSNNKCIYHSHLIVLQYKGDGPLILQNNQHNFKGMGENQRIMLHDKTRFLTLIPVEKKWFPRAWYQTVQCNSTAKRQTILQPTSKVLSCH